MNDAMIWIFGILAFIVLMTLVSRVNRRTPTWARFAGLHDRTSGPVPDLSPLRDDLAEIKSRLTTIEEILRSVE